MAGLGSDSLASDSLIIEAPRMAIMLERPAEPQAVAAEPEIRSDGLSWLLSALILVFVVACLRYRKNSRYLQLMFKDVFEVRVRHNAFDDTLRESTFLWLLNLLWSGGAGVLLYCFLHPATGGTVFEQADLTGMGICIAVAVGYTIFMAVAYSTAGHLFSDAEKATLWVKGYLSVQGLGAMPMFVAAVVALCVPGATETMVMLGAILFVLAKILFIYKGFCIFFTEIASWVLFLYYLCSLEIVPVVLAYATAKFFG